jgi:hypothetical protein
LDLLIEAHDRGHRAIARRDIGHEKIAGLCTIKQPWALRDERSNRLRGRVSRVNAGWFDCHFGAVNSRCGSRNRRGKEYAANQKYKRKHFHFLKSITTVSPDSLA